MKIITEDLKQEILKLYPKIGVAGTAKRMHIEYRRCKKVIVEANAWVRPPNAPSAICWDLRHFKINDYKELLKIAKGSVVYDFITDYLNSYGDGTIKELAKKYNVTDPTIQRLRVKLGMPQLFDANHPGNWKMIKRIKKLYYKGLSSLRIGPIVKMCPENVRKILLAHNVELRPSHVVDCKYFKTRSHLTPTLLLKEIKRLYTEEKMPLVDIAKEVGVWEGTVSSKLKAMGFDIITRRSMKKGVTIKPSYNIIGIYKGAEPYILWYWTGVKADFGLRKPNGPKGNCLWCLNEFTSYIAKGPRKQKYCCRQCKNKSKDLRRGLKPRFMKGKIRVYKKHFEILALEFKGDINKLSLPRDVKKKVIEIRSKGG